MGEGRLRRGLPAPKFPDVSEHAVADLGGEPLLGDAVVALRARLQVMDQLCPGDFAAVKRQCDILDATFSASEFLGAT